MDRITRSLPCALTPAEVAAAADEMATLVGRWEEADARRETFAKLMREEIKGYELNVRRLGAMVRTKTEPREVVCHVDPNDQDFTVSTIREDTGEVIHTRPMVPDEIAAARQQSLPGMPKSKRRRGKLIPMDGGAPGPLHDDPNDDDDDGLSPPTA